MLEVALHNPRQHKQFRSDARPLLFARDDDRATWTIIDRSAARATALVEIAPKPSGVAIAVTGCAAECESGRRDPGGQCWVAPPASFMVGDTRFEVVLVNNQTKGHALQELQNDPHKFQNRKSAGAGPSPQTLSRWFSALSSLNHWATSLQELYVHAAR